MILFLLLWPDTLKNMDSIEFELLKNRITEYIQLHLKESRLRHTYNVADLAVSMAEKYGADTRKAEIAALLHDMAKYENRPGVNMNLAHSKIAVEKAREEFGITDEDILNAVSYHTTGRAGMTLLEKIIFLADAIEPGRNYPGVKDIRKKAETDLDGACLMSLTRTVEFINNRGDYLDPDTLRAKIYLEENKWNQEN